MQHVKILNVKKIMICLKFNIVNHHYTGSYYSIVLYLKYLTVKNIDKYYTSDKVFRIRIHLPVSSSKITLSMDFISTVQHAVMRLHCFYMMSETYTFE